MKRIKGADVRNGDTIRREYAAPTGSLRAVEFVANVAIPGDGDALFLLDRPVPAVELPTVPTLGWVTVSHGGFQHNPAVAFVGPWQSGPHGMLAGKYEAGYRTLSGTFSGSEFITAFIPATAVPTNALNVLRKEMKRCLSFNHEMSSIEIFLAAVDAANRADR